MVGDADGAEIGVEDGEAEGTPLGLAVGRRVVGDAAGAALGARLAVGAVLGAADGAAESSLDECERALLDGSIEGLDPNLTSSAQIGFALPVIKLGWGVSVSLPVSTSTLLRWAERETAPAAAPPRLLEAPKEE